MRMDNDEVTTMDASSPSQMMPQTSSLFIAGMEIPGKGGVSLSPPLSSSTLTAAPMKFPQQQTDHSNSSSPRPSETAPSTTSSRSSAPAPAPPPSLPPPHPQSSLFAHPQQLHHQQQHTGNLPPPLDTSFAMMDPAAATLGSPLFHPSGTFLASPNANSTAANTPFYTDATTGGFAMLQQPGVSFSRNSGGNTSGLDVPFSSSGNTSSAAPVSSYVPGTFAGIHSGGSGAGAATQINVYPNYVSDFHAGQQQRQQQQHQQAAQQLKLHHPQLDFIMAPFPATGGNGTTSVPGSAPPLSTGTPSYPERFLRSAMNFPPGPRNFALVSEDDFNDGGMNGSGNGTGNTKRPRRSGLSKPPPLQTGGSIWSATDDAAFIGQAIGRFHHRQLPMLMNDMPGRTALQVIHHAHEKIFELMQRLNLEELSQLEKMLGLDSAAPFTPEEDKFFECGLMNEAFSHDRFGMIANILHKSKEDVRKRYVRLVMDLARMTVGRSLSSSAGYTVNARRGSMPPPPPSGSSSNG